MRKQAVADPTLKTVIHTAGNNRALKDGSVTPKSFSFDFEEVPVLNHAFRRMVRELAYDICEMAFTTYLCARAAGKPFTALPIFPVRAFHHSAIQQNSNAGLGGPEDVEGRRVGVNRGYTVTTGVWARGILQDEHGVDLSLVTWVLSGDEHVEEFVPPPNVLPVEAGKDIAQMLRDAELPAAIGLKVDHPDVEPLIPHPDSAGLEALRSRGLYPINHLIVVKDELLAARPELALDLFATFTEAKRRYLDRLHGGDIADPSPADGLYRKVMEIVGDPLPYGIESNRKMIDLLVDHALSQKIIDRPVAAEELFAPNTLGLSG